MIPKIIHCCWFGGPKTKLALKCRASWEKFAEGWIIKEWTVRDGGLVEGESPSGTVDDKDSNSAVQLPTSTKCLPSFALEALRNHKWAVVSDWARMRALYDEGGVYLDYDVELVRPFDPPEGEWVAGEWTASGETWMNPGSGIALEKGSPIARHLLEVYEKAVFEPQREMMPWINCLLAEAVDQVERRDGGGQSTLKVLDPEVLSPIDMKGRLRRTEKTLGIHHYALSWGGPKRKILQWLSWHGCRGLIDALVKIKYARRPALCSRPPIPSYTASIWEEHCLECAMPLCYGTCAMFERGWHGRCVRVDGFAESVLGTGTMRFRRWGKIELMYHGTMIGETGARRLERWNQRLGWLWRMLGAYYRAIRWRVAALCGHKGVPNCWRLRMKSEREEVLCAAIAYEDGREIFRETLPLKAGVETAFEFALPSVENGALFRIFPMNGEATGEIRFIENLVEAESRSRTVIKCVAWDLDGIVWDGTLSEGDDIKLRPRVVETIKALDAAGIVNSICSKNDQDVAIAKLKEFGIEEYFVFPQIGWGAKSAAIKNLAKEMNIALDAIAFVDDREENRADVRTNCPGVLVLDENASAGLKCGCGEGRGLGSARRVMYREEMARRGAARVFKGDAATFLAQSGLQVELLGVGAAERPRCFELVNRTNQLTITGRRYSESAFTELLRTCETRAVHVRDKYGDYGIVGFVAWRAEPESGDGRVEELVFSCRVACKGVERQVLKALPKGLKIQVVTTDRNGPIRKIVSSWQEVGR